MLSEATEDEAVAVIVVCQGPPRCPLQGDDAVRAAEAGCVWCERYRAVGGEVVHIDRPGEA